MSDEATATQADRLVEPLPDGLHQGGLLGEEYLPSRPRQPLSVAERVARHVAKRSDIGELPPVADPERRRRCSESLVEFVRTYGAELLDHEPSERLCGYLRELEAAIRGAGQVHVRQARGSGKTTLVKLAILWAVLTGLCSYVVVFGAAASLTAALLSDIWELLEYAEPLGEDWPEACVPIRVAEGLSQRWLGQHYHGRRTMVRRSARELRLPTIEGSPSSGALIVGLGAGSRTRGLVRGKRRPDLVLLDDIQSRDDARNPAACKKLEDWISGDVQGLTGSRLLNAVMTSTPIVEGDLSDRFADSDRHPEWRLVEHPLIAAEPRADGLWREYDRLWTEARRAGDAEFRVATAWYAAHRDEMDEGADVLDPLNYDRRLELSGYQHARNLRLTLGPAAFAAEYQLTTEGREDAVVVTPALVASRVNGSARLTLPPGTVQAVAAIDVNAGAGISWTVTGWGPHQTGAVLGYGRWPGGGARLVPANATDAETDRLIAAGLTHVIAQLLAMQVVRADTGAADRIAAVWADCGYRRRTVLRVCAVFRARTGRIVHGVQGYAHTRYSSTARHVVQRGAEGVDCRQADGETWYAQDSDLYRERAQRAWLAPPLTPGSLSLPGSDPRAHEDYAAEICAERLTDKLARERGRPTVYVWTAVPGVGNHWLDTTTTCVAMAAWYRLLDDPEEIDRIGRAASGLRRPEPPAPHAAALSVAAYARPRQPSPRRSRGILVASARMA